MRIPPRPLLSFDDREGLIASIQRRAGEEEINGELVPLRMGVDGGVQWFPKWGVHALSFFLFGLVTLSLLPNP